MRKATEAALSQAAPRKSILAEAPLGFAGRAYQIATMATRLTGMLI